MPPVLLKDINTGTDTTGPSPTALCVAGSTIYFVGADLRHGQELWKSDGTVGGTGLVKDIAPGDERSNIASAVAVGNVIYFTASNGSHGLELWKSDGTAEGTVMVKDIASGSAGSAPGAKFVVGSTIYFAANDGPGGVELWKSDGTAEGTVLVKDIMAGGGAIGTLIARAVGGTLFFNANDGVHGPELWKTDGTSEGTVMVRDIRTGDEQAPFPSGPTDFVAVGGTLYFSHTDAAHGLELWKSDGTEAGTVLVRDIVPGTGSSSPVNKVEVGGQLLFSATDAASGSELWCSDGTETGTVLVKDIQPGTGGSSIVPRVVAGAVYYFTASNSTTGSELWRSDGTNAGTVLVRDLTVGSFGSAFSSFGAVGGAVFFNFGPLATGRELWTTDGTSAGTVQVKDIWTGTGGSNPIDFVTLNGKVYFSAITGPANSITASSVDLWQSDGTDAGTTVIKPMSTGTASSSAAPRLVVGNTLYFSANDGITGSELWKTDGTAAGTSLVKDIHPGNGSSATLLTNVDGTVFFRADNGTNGAELWKMDGTAGGTVLVKDINPGSGTSNPGNFVVLGGVLYFTASNPTAGIELWRSDGTDAGTMIVKDIQAGNLSGGPVGLAVYNGLIYFSANDGVNGVELWRSDGSAEGTVIVKNIVANGGSSAPSQLKVVGQTLYFVATDNVNGFELWKTDGTDAGTVIVKNIHPTGNSSPNRLTCMGNTLFFTATDGANGTELWKSDGTEAGTMIVKDIVPGAGSPAGMNAFAAAGGVLYFPASDGSGGVELWRSDGTENGTTLVRDIRPGSANSDPRNFVVAGDWLYFSANDGVNGHELWSTDGTGAGTVMVHDLTGESGSSLPSDLLFFRGKVAFSATTPALGQELWLYTTPIPDIAVKLADVTLVDGDPTPVDFGTLLVGQTKELAFTINNVAEFPLGGLQVTIEGEDAADFSVTAQPSSPVQGPTGSTTFTVRFNPTTEGAKNATLRIASNDPDENPFDIGLAANARVPVPGVISVNLPAGSTLFANEADGVVNLPILRAGGTDFDVGFTAKATPGSASPGSDYVMPSGPFNLADGVSALSIPIIILDPLHANEKNETFTVTLSAPTGGASLGAVTTVTVCIVDSKDNAPPSAPTITYPAHLQSISLSSGQSINVIGKATDNRGIARVEVSLNGAAFFDAALASAGGSQSAFSATVVPVEGTNTLTARSTDTSGLVSSVSTRTFYVDSLLTVTAEAAKGSIYPSSFLGKSYRKLGKSYTITAMPKGTPAPGYVFSQWVIGGGFTAQDIGVTPEALKKGTLTFMHHGGLQLTAEFEPNPYAVVTGTYNGLIRGFGGPRTNGAICLVLQRSGAFSAKILLDGERFNVAGSLDLTGNANFGKTGTETLLLVRRGKPTISIDFQIDIAPGAGLAGVATQDDGAGGTFTSNIFADRAVFDGVTRSVPAEYLSPNGSPSTYTVVLRVSDSQPLLLLDPEDSPQGFSFAALTLTKAGKIHLVGQLSDDTKLTASSTLTEGALQMLTSPIFTTLYHKNGGFFATQLVFDASQQETDLTGTETLWSRPPQPGSAYPDGWSLGLLMEVKGARYLVASGQSVMRTPDGFVQPDDEDSRGDDLPAADADGNAELTFEGLELDPIVKNVNISPQDAVARLPQSDNTFVLSVIRPLGRINGHFDNPFQKNRPKPAFDGIIYQKGAAAGAYGFFRSQKPQPNDPDRGFGTVTLIGK